MTWHHIISDHKELRQTATFSVYLLVNFYLLQSGTISLLIRIKLYFRLKYKMLCFVKEGFGYANQCTWI